ncbi:hypothetical protein, partial [Rhizorhabdus wittichii]|uniref:hypothetical protein n=1 Tax=Rhizorhabdus wittichii TaxID=160791 RepID=UPI001D012B6D
MSTIGQTDQATPKSIRQAFVDINIVLWSTIFKQDDEGHQHDRRAQSGRRLSRSREAVEAGA